MPASGPALRFAIARSCARAAFSARSKSRTQIALTFASCRSICAMASCVSSSDDTFFARSALRKARADWNVHAETFLGMGEHAFGLDELDDRLQPLPGL